MWFDVLKNQISVGRQKLRSSKRPLPDEDNDEDCRTKFKRLVQYLESSSVVKVTFKSIMQEIDELPDRFFCEAIEQLIAYVDEYKTIEDIPLIREHENYTDGFYAQEFFEHFTIKIYTSRRVLSLDFRIEAHKKTPLDDRPKEILEDKYQVLRALIMRFL